MALSNTKFRGKAAQAVYARSFAGRYEHFYRRHSFLAFGLPLMVTLVGALYGLENFTAVRIERQEREVREMTESEALALVDKRQPVDIKQQYYQLQGLGEQDYEMQRVPRLKGELENKW